MKERTFRKSWIFQKKSDCSIGTVARVWIRPWSLSVFHTRSKDDSFEGKERFIPNVSIYIVTD